MVKVWDQLKETEREILIALHKAAASPRSVPQTASTVLLHALYRIGRCTAEAEEALQGRKTMELPAFVEELDRALMGLVQRPRNGLRLVEGGWGNWGGWHGSSSPCHPRFRECRLSVDGQRLVLEALKIMPESVEDPVLGHLVWNSTECWWEGKLNDPPTQIALYQDVPGIPFSPDLPRQTLRAIRERESHIRQATAAAAANPDNVFYRSEASSLPPPIAEDELSQRLTLFRIVLNARGGARMDYLAKGWHTCEIEVWVTIAGSCEEISVWC